MIPRNHAYDEIHLIVCLVPCGFTLQYGYVLVGLLSVVQIRDTRSDESNSVLIDALSMLICSKNDRFCQYRGAEESCAFFLWCVKKKELPILKFPRRRTS